jgi:hypothetical protein
MVASLPSRPRPYQSIAPVHPSTRYVDSWLARQFPAEEDKALVRDLFEKWVVRLLDFKRREVGRALLPRVRSTGASPWCVASPFAIPGSPKQSPPSSPRPAPSLSHALGCVDPTPPSRHPNANAAFDC